MESLGPSRPMRTGRALTGSGLRNRFPELPLSGVKKPNPVAVGRGGCVALVVGCCSSGEVRLIGGGREGNKSSISGTDPAKAKLEINKGLGQDPTGAFHLNYTVPRKPPISWG